MRNIRTFALQETDLMELSLRVFRYSDDSPKCAKSGYGCDASIVVGNARKDAVPSQDDRAAMSAYDGKWPSHCDACGQPFGSIYQLQFNAYPLYTRSDNGPLTTIRNAPVGAVYEATWLKDTSWGCGPDGRAVMIKTPDKPDGTGISTWHVDDRASNCTRKDDRTHKCWCRHGPLECLTVDKNCDTCSAGAGSILAHGGYHAMLQGGVLRQC